MAKWCGVLELREVQKGCALMFKFIKANKVKCHLSDHRELKMLSREVQDYLTNTWFPEVEAVGLTKVGALVSEDVFAAATVSKVNHHGSVGNLQIRMFNSEFECKKWFLS